MFCDIAIIELMFEYSVDTEISMLIDIPTVERSFTFYVIQRSYDTLGQQWTFMSPAAPINGSEMSIHLLHV